MYSIICCQFMTGVCFSSLQWQGSSDSYQFYKLFAVM
jgi:hypothetical protein